MGGGSDCTFEDKLISHFFFGPDEVHKLFEVAYFWDPFYKSFAPFNEYSPDCWGIVGKLSILLVLLPFDFAIGLNPCTQNMLHISGEIPKKLVSLVNEHFQIIHRALVVIPVEISKRLWIDQGQKVQIRLHFFHLGESYLFLPATHQRVPLLESLQDEIESRVWTEQDRWKRHLHVVFGCTVLPKTSINKRTHLVQFEHILFS